MKKFDDKLMELYKMRLAIEKCILAEELKILLHDRQMSGDCFLYVLWHQVAFKFRQSGVPTRDLLSRQILKVCALSRVEARF